MPRSKSASPTLATSANLSPAEIRAAIPQLERRIADLEAVPVAEITDSSDARWATVRHAVTSTLATIFGTQTDAYHRLFAALNARDHEMVTKMARAPRWADHGLPVHLIREGLERRRKRMIALLAKEIELMKEQLGDNGDTTAGRAIRAYSNLDLHPEIARAANGLYRDGHYANAIEDAVKALNSLVRLRSGKELDGADLMKTVFSPKNPVLRFSELQDRPDQDEQEGFMMMFSGAVAGLRNPRAHKFIKDDPERALEFIAFVSLLAKLLDGAVKM